MKIEHPKLDSLYDHIIFPMKTNILATNPILRQRHMFDGLQPSTLLNCTP